MKAPTLHGVMAEFDSPEQLLSAARHAVDAGYHELDAYTPFPIKGLDEALRLRPTRMSLLMLLGGLSGGLIGYALQYSGLVISYPLNVGGRPLHSWPAFVPVTFELIILGAALAGVAGLFFLNGLPMPYHPVFNVPEFENASRTGFFLCIEASDPRFDLAQTKKFLASLSPRGVHDVLP